jgi:hypothetical protein
MRDDWGAMTGQLHQAAPAPAAAPHRSDAGTVRLGQRDIDGLILCAEHFGAPYDLPAPRGAVLYSPRSGQRLEELSLDLMAYLNLKR